VRQIWIRYDAKPSGPTVFSQLITALKRLATEKPSLLGVDTQLYGIGVNPQTHEQGTTGAYGLDVGAVAGMVASAANIVGISGSGNGLSVHGASMKLQW
jgi:hypothetical protein